MAREAGAVTRDICKGCARKNESTRKTGKFGFGVNFVGLIHSPVNMMDNAVIFASYP